jgi:hypothetical protein
MPRETHAATRIQNDICGGDTPPTITMYNQHANSNDLAFTRAKVTHWAFSEMIL